jgi:hypothetical protein
VTRQEDLFGGGPPCRIERYFGLIKPDDRRIRRRAVLAVLITWGPLFLITVFQEILHRDGALLSFLHDFGVNARFLVAAPLFIIAESWCLPRMKRVLYHFIDSGIVQGEDRQKLCKDFDGTRRLVNSRSVEILAIGCAYAIVAAVIATHPLESLAVWHARLTPLGYNFTAAGLWHLGFSLPVLVLLSLGWLWRQLLWWRLLRRISRLQLHLTPAHPDHLGGLRFVAAAMRGYWPLAFAMSAIVAGKVGNHLQAGSTPYEARYLILGVLAFVLAFVLAPFTSFMPNLRKLRERGMFQYDALGHAMGELFERKWLNTSRPPTPAMLDAPDFSSAIDLYSTIGNTHQISYFPVGMRAMRELVIVTLLPFIPVVLSLVPFETIVSSAAKLLL